MDEVVSGDGALPPDAAGGAWSVDPHADTGPIPVVADLSAATDPAAAHHTHVLHGHPHVAPPVHHEPPRHVERHGRRTALVAGGVAAVLLAVGAVSAYAFTRGSDPAPLAGATAGAPQDDLDLDADAPLAPGISASGSTPPLAASVPTLVLGDSLGLTVYPWLADLLPDRYVSYEAEVGRSTADTATALESLPKIPRVVIVSSGTNDQSAGEVKQQATRILDRLGPRRCVVWVDVVRPDTIGDPQDEINAAIDKAVAGRANVRVLRWSEMIDEHPDWMSSDGVHPDQAGAQARADAFAEAALACSPLDPEAPRAEQQYLPASAFGGPLSGQGSGTGSSGSGTTGTSGSTRSPSPSSTKKPKPSTSATPKPTSASPSATKPPDPPPSPSPSVAPTTSAGPAQGGAGTPA